MPPIAPNAGLVAEPTADAAPKAGADGFPKPVTPAPTGEAAPKADPEGFPKLVAPDEGVVVVPNALAGREGCPNAELDIDDD